MAWSLYERTSDDSSEGANLFNYTGKKLEPLMFSNGKSQEDVVQEVLDMIHKGHKIIFIKGVCGSGKSAMALNLAKHFPKSSIVVPIKSLQEQYERDYTQKKFVLKDDGNPLKISVIKGRNNFPCHYTGEKADDPEAPCTVELREKNLDLLLRYIEKNPLTDKEDFSEVSDVKRMNVAPACPYWSPIMPADIEPKGIRDFKKKKYMSVSGKEFAIFKRKVGCPFYDQYDAYADSDVLIFNSAKYAIEMSLGRKPKTQIDIIDECDEFLDSFANERRLNCNRLLSSLSSLMPPEQDRRSKIKEIINKLNGLIFNPPKIEVEKISRSPINDLLRSILENPNLAEEEENSYYHTAVEIARSFENLIDETYVSVEVVKRDAGQTGLFGEGSKEDIVLVNLVSINLAQKFKELIDANNVLVLMSGTLHSPEVLKDIFGLDNFKIIEAETKSPGEVKKYLTGLERNCSYANFSNGTISRDMYLKILDVCLANAKGQTLVHVNAFKDLPSEEENARLKFENLITQEDLRQQQTQGNGPIDSFSSKQDKVLFTTKCARGVDFPGDTCETIIMTRFPYPNIQGLFWKILKKEQPEKFMEFYLDRARRDLIQKVARGVRFKGDSVIVLSPDNRVMNAQLD